MHAHADSIKTESSGSSFKQHPVESREVTTGAVRTHSALPTAAVARKAVPIYSGVVRYFPNALAAIAELSRIGNDQHNPGKPLHWDRSKSGDELDALTRHLVEAGTIDTDGVRHSTKVAWRALANLEKELENLCVRTPDASDPNPWRKHDGGGCPCDPCRSVDVRWRSSGELCGVRPTGVRWEHTGTQGDVVGWRYTDTQKEAT